MRTRDILSAPLALTLLAATLASPVPTSAQVTQCGDLNDSGSVTSTDALLLLKEAVGQPVDIVCDQCGSTCPGDPRYLLGQWVFETEFGDTLYEDNYDLFAVDEGTCDIVGQDLDDLGFVYAYAGTEYDYVLVDQGDTYCDVFLFDYIGPDEVEGYDVLVDLDEFGYCDLEASYDEGLMIGDRVADYGLAASSARAATLVGPRRSKAELAEGETRPPADPKVAAALSSAKKLYEQRPR